ncbi:MAG TPA: hypothetical protein VF619_13490, partial [Allosphingosinicella sp.]
ISLAGRLAPRATDLAMEAFGVGAQQKPGDAGDPAKRDNLYEAKADGESHGAQDVFVRRTSLFLQAQTQPLLLPLVAAAAGAEMAGGLARSLLQRPRRHRRGSARANPPLRNMIEEKRTMERKEGTGEAGEDALVQVEPEPAQEEMEQAQKDAAEERESERGYQ